MMHKCFLKRYRLFRDSKNRILPILLPSLSHGDRFYRSLPTEILNTTRYAARWGLGQHSKNCVSLLVSPWTEVKKLINSSYLKQQCPPVFAYVCGVFNSFPEIFVQTFKIVKLLLYILWDDWIFFIISGANEQLKPDCHSWWILKRQSGREDTLEEQYAIKLCFKLGKNARETYGIL